MRRILPLLAVLCLLPFACTAEGDLSILDTDELIVEEFEGDEDTAYWDFPVALEDLDPELVVLANKHYVLDEKYGPSSMVKMKTRKANKDGSNANGGVLKAPNSGTLQLQAECAEALVAMCEGARADGVNLYLKSSYRAYSTQKTMYYNRLKKNNGKDDGWVAKPGTSDHQTGLGCDVVPKSWYDRAMNEKMASTKECRWMAAHCQEYGFILRYPKEKQDVTEINYEPWHMRYVGIPAATYIMENDLCLEEFNDELQAAIASYLENGGDRAKVETLIREPNAP